MKTHMKNEHGAAAAPPVLHNIRFSRDADGYRVCIPAGRRGEIGVLLPFQQPSRDRDGRVQADPVRKKIINRESLPVRKYEGSPGFRDCFRGADIIQFVPFHSRNRIEQADPAVLRIIYRFRCLHRLSVTAEPGQGDKRTVPHENHIVKPAGQFLDARLGIILRPVRSLILHPASICAVRTGASAADASEALDSGLICTDRILRAEKPADLTARTDLHLQFDSASGHVIRGRVDRHDAPGLLCNLFLCKGISHTAVFLPGNSRDLLPVLLSAEHGQNPHRPVDPGTAGRWHGRALLILITVDSVIRDRHPDGIKTVVLRLKHQNGSLLLPCLRDHIRGVTHRAYFTAAPRNVASRSVSFHNMRRFVASAVSVYLKMKMAGVFSGSACRTEFICPSGIRNVLLLIENRAARTVPASGIDPDSDRVSAVRPFIIKESPLCPRLCAAVLIQAVRRMQSDICVHGKDGDPVLTQGFRIGGNNSAGQGKCILIRQIRLKIFIADFRPRDLSSSSAVPCQPGLHAYKFSPSGLCCAFYPEYGFTAKKPGLTAGPDRFQLPGDKDIIVRMFRPGLRQRKTEDGLHLLPGIQGRRILSGRVCQRGRARGGKLRRRIRVSAQRGRDLLLPFLRSLPENPDRRLQAPGSAVRYFRNLQAPVEYLKSRIGSRPDGAVIEKDKVIAVRIPVKRAVRGRSRASLLHASLRDADLIRQMISAAPVGQKGGGNADQNAVRIQVCAGMKFGLILQGEIHPFAYMIRIFLVHVIHVKGP